MRGKSFVERVLAASAAGTDPLDRLTRGVRAYVDFLFEHRAWLRIHLQTRMSWGLRPSDGYAADYWQRGLDDLAANLTEGMKSGVFYADGDAHTMSALAQAVMQVEVSRAVERTETDAARVAGEIMRQLQRLLCPRQAG
jgi:hypothetical protein